MNAIDRQVADNETCGVSIRDDVSRGSQCIEHGSPKIQAHHKERLAVVYVRQSSPHQVLEHRESKELQYRLVDRAAELGWSTERILVIDQDQGQSARSADDRLGFQRLLAEVGLSHVGLVLGIEMSRLARSNMDWHQLLELCAMFRTLLADQDGLYDLQNYNDRLLLGLKGTMSEAELHILKARMIDGRRNKAKRGELFNEVPFGYILLPSGQPVLDPDEQVQAVVRLIFDKFEEFGTALAVLRYLADNQIRLPVRLKNVARRGELVWQRPRYDRINRTLHHPMYAGAYSHGRHLSLPRSGASGRAKLRSTLVPMEQWRVLLRDRLPAYITWDRYLANQRQLANNAGRFARIGAPRNGPSILGGIVFCGHCGRRMRISYPGKNALVRYTCQNDVQIGMRRACQALEGAVLEDLISRLVLRAIEPATVELSLRAIDDIERERDHQHKHWQQRLERAAYEAERAKRQYDAVEPENRLVARELERRWEKCLLDAKQLQDEYDRFCSEQTAKLSEQERSQIRALAADIPALWNAVSTAATDRQTIVRHVVERIAVTAQGETERVDVTVHWCGGFVSQHEIRRSVNRYERLQDYPALKERVLELHRGNSTPGEIAKVLNNEGFKTPQRNKTYTAAIVRRFFAALGFDEPRHTEILRASCMLQRHEFWLRDLAAKLSLARQRLREWCYHDWVHARIWQGRRRFWVIWADDSELCRLGKLRDYMNGPRIDPLPPELILRGPRTD